MTKCPWCEKYVELSLRQCSDRTTFTEDVAEREKERIDASIWATIQEIQCEEEMVNKLGMEAALKLGGRIFINLKSGETYASGFDFYQLARMRDEVYGTELQHCWIESGACSTSFRTAICCELANATSFKEAVEWETQEFGEVASLGERMVERVSEEPL